MGLETGDKIVDLNPAWPLGTDPKSQGDDHIRLIKAILQADATDAATLQAAVDALQASIDDKVAKAGDTMTGNLTVPDGSAAGHAVNKGQLDGALPNENHDVSGVASYLIIGNTLMCWGESATVSGDRTITLPKTYARADYAISFGTQRRGDGAPQPVVGLNGAPLVGSFSFRVNDTNGSAITESALWMTIGQWDGVS